MDTKKIANIILKGRIADLLDQVQECGIDSTHPELELPCIDNGDVAEHLIANNITWIPIKTGQNIYKICPVCNPKHNGGCEHCAWRGCQGYGCDVGVRVCSDGSHGDYDLQIILRAVTIFSLTTILKWWNIMYFPTKEEAEKAMKEYLAIREIEDRAERYRQYKEWEDGRRYHFPFLKYD